MTDLDVDAAHHHSIRHRPEIEASHICGCFYCGDIFPPTDIEEWIDEHEPAGETALCPKCGIDSVIGAASRYPITPEFLERMRQRWFGRAEGVPPGDPT